MQKMSNEAKKKAFVERYGEDYEEFFTLGEAVSEERKQMMKDNRKYFEAVEQATQAEKRANSEILAEIERETAERREARLERERLEAKKDEQLIKNIDRESELREIDEGRRRYCLKRSHNTRRDKVCATCVDYIYCWSHKIKNEIEQ